jgi:hypothetical protein
MALPSKLVVPVSKVVRGKVLDELVQIKCDGKAVSSLRNCVRNGTLCSDAGECQNNRCICSPERTGEFCDELADDDADALNAASIAAIAACVLIGACVAALAIVACAFLIVLAITRKRNVRSQGPSSGNCSADVGICLKRVLVCVSCTVSCVVSCFL